MPNSTDILYAIGLVQRRLGQWDASLASMTRAAQLDPRNPAIAVALADNYDALGRVADAERELDRSLVLRPTSTVGITRKANLLENHLGDTARGRMFIETSGKLLPPTSRGLFDARVALLARDYPRAMVAYRTTEAGFRTANLWRERSLCLGLTAAASGDSALARIYADTLLQRGDIALKMRRLRGPSDPFGGQALIESQMAVAHALRGERDAAMRMAELTLRYDPARDAMEGARNVQLVAVAYSILGRRAEAVALLTRLMSGPSPIHSAELRFDPAYDGLRSEPGFQKLVASGK
jgi:tetratricopeptide (TPR) repeat protein